LIILLPYRGEFGHVCMWHAPSVHALSATDGKLVCCEPGTEALYPSATDFEHVGRRNDADRVEHVVSDRDLITATRNQLRSTHPRANMIEPSQDLPRKYFTPRPRIEYGIDNVDVVICPRKRDYGPRKNWEHWPELARRLGDAGLRVFAAGAPVSSVSISGVDASWNRGRYLGATIEAMHAAKLVIATDAGLAHLAVMCGRPLYMIVHGHDQTAPGYQSVKWERYRQENHANAPIVPLSGTWSRPDLVAKAVGDFMAQRDKGVG